MILPQSDTPFIPKLDGSHLNKNFGRTTMTILTREAGLPYYAPHGLRHTHATNLANTEIPIKLLSHRLGHASVKTTMDRYAKVKTKASVKYLKKSKSRMHIVSSNTQFRTLFRTLFVHRCKKAIMSKVTNCTNNILKSLSTFKCEVW